jgi:hypothetical protein
MAYPVHICQKSLHKLSHKSEFPFVDDNMMLSMLNIITSYSGFDIYYYYHNLLLLFIIIIIIIIILPLLLLLLLLLYYYYIIIIISIQGKVYNNVLDEKKIIPILFSSVVIDPLFFHFIDNNLDLESLTTYYNKNYDETKYQKDINQNELKNILIKIMGMINMYKSRIVNKNSKYSINSLYFPISIGGSWSIAVVSGLASMKSNPTVFYFDPIVQIDEITVASSMIYSILLQIINLIHEKQSYNINNVKIIRFYSSEKVDTI